MKITEEYHIVSEDLEKRLGPGYKVYRVKNSPRGIIISEDGSRSSWRDLGYLGDERRNRYAIECRARNGRAVAAIAWWENPDRENQVSTLGTYVSKGMRRRGLGTALWRAMIRTTEAKVVYSEPVTDEGLTLIRSLQEKLKGVQIKEIDSGDLEYLEDLRKRKQRRRTA